MLQTFATLVVLMIFSGPAHAHSLGEGYVFLRIGLDSLEGQIQITFEDLDKAFDLDRDGNGRVEESEVEPHMGDIHEYLLSRISIGSESGDYAMTLEGYEFHRFPEGQYLEQKYVLDIQGPVPDILKLRYEMLFDVDSMHRGFLVIPENAKSGRVNAGEETTLRFSPDETAMTLDITALSRWQSFRTFVVQGMWHIWIGIDHVLFLVALILPSVLVRNGRRWQPVQDTSAAIWNIVKIVTLFTIAHTITLSLAALELVSLPSQLVESVIAASVLFAALNNVFPLLRKHMGYVVFGFGLFHGFGFASVLSHLIKNRSNLVVDLLGFNVGVEIGQIAIIMLVFPVLAFLRKRTFYVRVLLPVASILIAVLALGWLIDRTFDLSMMPI